MGYDKHMERQRESEKKSLSNKEKKKSRMNLIAFAYIGITFLKWETYDRTIRRNIRIYHHFEAVK